MIYKKINNSRETIFLRYSLSAIKPLILREKRQKYYLDVQLYSGYNEYSGGYCHSGGAN